MVVNLSVTTTWTLQVGLVTLGLICRWDRVVDHVDIVRIGRFFLMLKHVSRMLSRCGQIVSITVDGTDRIGRGC